MELSTGVNPAMAVALILWMLGSPAAAQSPRLKNIQLCNGADRTSLEPQIRSCTALIDFGREKPYILAVAHNNRGIAYAAMGDYGRAMDDFDQSIKLKPDYANPFNNRGLAYRKKGDYERAIKDFNEAIKLDPSYALAFANRAETYQSMNDYTRADLDYSEALRLEPKLDAIRNDRCWVRALLGNYQGALEDCNKAVELEPDNAGPYDSRGLIYLKTGQFDAAIDDFSSALRLTPNLASALYGVALSSSMALLTACADSGSAWLPLSRGSSW